LGEKQTSITSDCDWPLVARSGSSYARPSLSGSVDQRAGTVEDELTLDPHVERAPILLEFLGVKTAMGGQAKIDAAVAGQVLRRPRLLLG
jgi:hypothetical protein